MHGFTSISKGDLEEGTLYPGLSYGENQLRWGFIRKVYGILSAQILLTTIVSSITVLYSPINELLKGNSGILLFFAILPLILMWPLHIYHQKHPVNFILLGLFTASLSVTVGVACANTEGTIVLEALILTCAVVGGLTGYTFWASKKGKDFSYLGPFLFTSLIVLMVAGFMQVKSLPQLRFVFVSDICINAILNSLSKYNCQLLDSLYICRRRLQKHVELNKSCWHCMLHTFPLVFYMIFTTIFYTLKNKEGSSIFKISLYCCDTSVQKQRIQHILLGLGHVVFNHAPRACNITAHCIAASAKGASDDYLWFDQAPPWLEHTIALDFPS